MLRIVTGKYLFIKVPSYYCRNKKYKEIYKGYTLMEMSVYNSNYKLGIDTSVLKQVSAEILKRAEAKNSQYNTSSFNSVLKNTDIGVDLYKGQVDSTTAKQIALNNSGLQIQLSQNALKAISFLNSQAAIQNVQKSVEGKMTVAVNEINGQPSKTETTPVFNSIVANSTSKDKNGSNPFYHGELLMQNSKKGNKIEDAESIFNA